MPIRVLFVGVMLILSSTACTSSGSAAPSAMDKWSKAYAFLAAQTKPTEMLCPWSQATADGHVLQSERPVGFYSFTDRAAWQSHEGPDLHLLLGHPGTSFEACEATVPVSVPNGAAVNAFLARYGLVTGASAPGKTFVMIDYLGRGPSFLKTAYRDKPGLFGLYLAFFAMQPDPYQQNAAKLTQPTDDATATKYLQYAQPLLAWYGYTG